MRGVSDVVVCGRDGDFEEIGIIFGFCVFNLLVGGV